MCELKRSLVVSLTNKNTPSGVQKKNTIGGSKKYKPYQVVRFSQSERDSETIKSSSNRSNTTSRWPIWPSWPTFETEKVFLTSPHEFKQFDRNYFASTIDKRGEFDLSAMVCSAFEGFGSFITHPVCADYAPASPASNSN